MYKMEEEKKKEKSRELFVIRIGVLLRKVLDEQKKQIKEATYGVCESSDYEAGEIIAKKFLKID